MDLKAQLNQALKEAMKSGDEIRKRTVRMALAAIKQAEIDRQVTLDDQGVLSILQREIKTRRESLEEAQKAGREDLVQALQAEIAVLQAFLPQALSAEELCALAKAVIEEVGASSVADMGRVMKALMPRVANRAPGDQVSQIVRSLLTGT
ncbi:MAG: GatB/YqeY domain-containing protein [Chloroflexi bacterium]|nr:GatB/YqeY domain-containing protein [Chloroflexota bacterium]